MAVSQKTIEKIKTQTDVFENIKVFVRGNSKLGEGNMLIFNLPPIRTCRPTKWCMQNCYGMKANHTFSNVIKSNETRYQMSLRDDFVANAMTELDKYKNVMYIRIHSTGDYYSQLYVEKWAEIVKTFPDKKFLSFTKRYDLVKPLRKLAGLSNMSMFESMDESKQRARTMFKIARVKPEHHVTNEKEFECPGGCPDCGYECWNTDRNVIFHKH